MVEIRRPIVEATRELCSRWPLRGYAAVQLSAAKKLLNEETAVDFWSADQNLTIAARGEGMSVTLLD